MLSGLHKAGLCDHVRRGYAQDFDAGLRGRSLSPLSGLKGLVCGGPNCGRSPF